ncbi:MAG: c-type cytochrome domain-containing protein [Pirellulaceae bacterium]
MGTYPTIGVPLGVPLRLLLVVALWSLQAVAVRASEPIVNVGDSQQTSQFESHIRPIFREYCFDCHGATEELSSGMDLRLVRFLIAGGDSGPAIAPGDAEGSYLLELVSSGEMPPGEVHLPAEKVQLIEQWITAGAPTLRPEPETIGPGVPLSVEDRSYWAYQPIVAALPPIDPSPVDPSPQPGAIARSGARRSTNGSRRPCQRD